jgi:putative CocE/NonD family hydrolase
MDQRPLADRKDILRFVTEPLDEPLEITGRVFVQLGISTDVRDTTFTAKLIDVYPDGYEALLLDSAAMTRYWQGPDRPQPLEPGRTYPLKIDLWSTAIVFAKGHRIAVHVSSSNAPRFEPHPNTYEPVDSYDDSPIAHQKVHVGGAIPSRVVLPVIPAWDEK